MSYNIDTFQLITSKNFYLDLDSPCNTEGFLEFENFKVNGKIEDRKIYITGFNFLNEETGWIFREELEPLLKQTRGEAYFLEIWEGSDTMSIMAVRDGEIIGETL